jgi:hypothetical protein
MFPAPALLGTAGLGALYFISAPAREFLARKFRKLPDISRHKIFRPCWQQGGLLGLGLIFTSSRGRVAAGARSGLGQQLRAQISRLKCAPGAPGGRAREKVENPDVK